MRTIALSLVAVLAALALAEGALRMAGFANYWTLYRRAEPDIGWLPQPNVVSAQSWEGEAEVRTNALGFRGPDFGTKREGVLRIAVLGDSFTEAVQVEAERTWWGRLGPAVEACLSTPAGSVEVLNFGVSGYSTAQALISLDKFALPSAPDLVVLNFFAGNDVAENAPSLDHDAMRPYFRLVNGELRPDNAFRDRPEWRRRAAGWWRAAIEPLLRTRLMQLLDAARDRWALSRAPSPAHWLDAEPGVDLAVYREPATPEWREGWTITEALLKRFEQRTRDGGAKFLLMLATTGYQTLPAPRRAQFADRHQLAGLGYPQRRLQAMGDAEGWNVLNLAPVLQFWADNDSAIVHGFANSLPFIGHWNERGHEIAAGALAARICASTTR